MNPIGLVLIAGTLVVPALQLAGLPNITDQAALFSQYLGMASLILMAWGQILSTRLPGIETIFGGLDRVYVLHKWAGIVAMLTMLVHDTVDADMRGLGRGGGLNDLAETFGEISLYGLLILVVLSVATFIPYHLWKWTHKAMGALFAAGVFHFVFILKPFSMTDPAGLFTGLICLAGLAAYVWMLLPERLRPSHGYRIATVEQTGGALAVTLAPEGRGLRAAPGQFGLFRFTGAGLEEAHPFTFSGLGPDGALRVTVKGLGDFTNDLPAALDPGQAVRVQGPFGRFRLRAKRPEIWVAAGIGITPFLAGAQALPTDGPAVDLFYAIRSRAEAPHLAEIEALAAANPRLRLHLVISSAGERLTAKHIAERVGDLSKRSLSYCGPTGLRDSLRRDLKALGLPARRFHYEAFEFRTGIGLSALAAWILARRTRAARARAV